MAKTKIAVAYVHYTGLAHTMGPQKSPTGTLSGTLEAASGGRIADMATA